MTHGVEEEEGGGRGRFPREILQVALLPKSISMAALLDVNKEEPNKEVTSEKWRVPQIFWKGIPEVKIILALPQKERQSIQKQSTCLLQNV